MLTSVSALSPVSSSRRFPKGRALVTQMGCGPRNLVM